MIHLYNKTSSSQQIKETIGALGSCQLMDISMVTSVPKYEVYFVEIDKVEKELLLDIKKLLFDKTQSLIYFFINDSHSLMLFQLASLLKVESIFTQKHNTSKIISTIKKEILESETTSLEHSIANTITNDKSFMVFDTNRLHFASQKLYKEYDCKNLDEVKLKICSQVDINALLKEDISIQNELGLFTSSTSKLDKQKYIYLEAVSQNSNLAHLDFIKNRIYFIEILKDKFLENSISKTSLGLITIQVENMSNLRKDWNEYEIEVAVHGLLLQIETAVDSYKLLAQYDNHLYVTLFEGLDFKELKQKASMMQTHIAGYTHEQKIKPLVGIYAIDINSLELNTILKIVSGVSREEILHEHIESKKLYKVMNINEDLDDAVIIDMMLQATFTNKTPIKLLNLYKGICINTSSIIVKKMDQEIYVRYEQLQGTVMAFDKVTVMQSSNFSKDIVADVTYMDSKKRVAQFKNFRFVQGNANARKYSRVTPPQRTHVSIVGDRITISGDILDISMNSIAIQTRVRNKINALKLDQTTLKFGLPNKNADDGYVKLELTGKVIFTKSDEEFCKIVIDLDEDQANESILMEYVYNRQKEIILELKRQTSVLK